MEIPYRKIEGRELVKLEINYRSRYKRDIGRPEEGDSNEEVISSSTLVGSSRIVLCAKIKQFITNRSKCFLEVSVWTIVDKINKNVHLSLMCAREINI